MTTSLQDDSVDIGLDEPPPSPDDVSTDEATGARAAGVDPLAGLGGDDDDDAGMGDGLGDGGSDVFGFQPAPDEDARHRGDSATGGSRSHSAFAAVSEDTGRPTVTTSAGSRPTSTSSPDATAAGANTLEALLADPAVTCVVINAGSAVQVERGGKLETAGPMGDGNAIAEAVWQLANTALPPPAADNPVVDVRLLDGTRVTALFPPIAAASVTATIRKAGAAEVPLADAAGSGDVEKILSAAVASRRNLLLCGDAPAISALAGALAATFPAERRVVSVGTGVKSHPGWIDLANAGDPAGLVRAAAAFRADHLLVAEAGGAEWPELLLAAARGQEGIIGALAARSAAEALTRLRAFCVQAIGGPALPALVASTIDMVVLAGTTSTGAVRVLEIAEPNADGDALTSSFIARRSENRTTTTLDVSGVSSRLASAIAVAADTLPDHLIRRG